MQESLQQLVKNTIDYAGLFPPAGLDLPTVVENYAQYSMSDDLDMLSRLIIPASKLDEFKTAFESNENASEKAPWQISALCPPIAEDGDDSALKSSLSAIGTFNSECADSIAMVDTIEIKAHSIELINATVDAIPTQISCFLEVPWNADVTQWIQRIKECANGNGVFAKIRTGGVTPELIPPTSKVAEFISACSNANVGFKATAGLHHPLRADFPLTYEPDAPVATMHGYLNVFVAAMLAYEHHLDSVQIDNVLQATSISEFEFSEAVLRFNDSEVPTDHIAKHRQESLISFGSCSFTEPTLELKQLVSG